MTSTSPPGTATYSVPPAIAPVLPPPAPHAQLDITSLETPVAHVQRECSHSPTQMRTLVDFVPLSVRQGTTTRPLLPVLPVHQGASHAHRQLSA